MQNGFFIIRTPRGQNKQSFNYEKFELWKGNVTQVRIREVKYYKIRAAVWIIHIGSNYGDKIVQAKIGIKMNQDQRGLVQNVQILGIRIMKVSLYIQSVPSKNPTIFKLKKKNYNSCLKENRRKPMSEIFHVVLAKK